ncbi:FAD-dependent oxidoreductase [Streptomyces sp. NPDC092129]|uniref:FAD-dependent oxidoreductase n=1 Tax=Streptomyces sp. NPDC092129 TaxID=3366010 RepID=UPI0037F2E9DD
MDQVQALTSLFRAGNYDGLNGMDTVTVVTGRAVFTDPHTVAVGEGEGRLTITGDTILINTGSEPVVPDIPGLRASEYLVTSTDLIEATTLPKQLAIIGGGYLGLEFASIYRRFGSEVTLLEASPHILRREDDDIAAAVLPSSPTMALRS